jgi:hypothetical protein
MATQKDVTSYLKQWQEAETIKEAKEAAGKAARCFDSLQEQSALNLLNRTPDLMLLLSAYVAGKEDGASGRETIF